MSSGVDSQLTYCSAPLCRWYRENKRSFPWREQPEPYAVWVSEIMLQQTRIEAALPYYRRFLDTLPTVQALAEADEGTVLKLWEGLGYYSRVRNMQKAARIILERHGGVFPTDFKEIVALPGIGDYTAGAIASICFGTPVPAVDGNVLRVLARLRNDPADVMLPATKKAAVAQITELLKEVPEPGDFNQGIMELGERVCLPNGAPLCESCPLQAWCLAHKAGTQLELPVRTVVTKRRKEKRTVLICISAKKTPRLLLHRRPDSGLLAGLWELPALPEHPTAAEAVDAVCSLGANVATLLGTESGKHIFSHLEWHMVGYAIRTDAFTAPTDHVWVTAEELAETYALPSAFRPFTALIQHYLQEDMV